MGLRCTPNKQQMLDLFIVLQRIVCELPALPQLGDTIEFNPIMVPGEGKKLTTDAKKCSFSITRQTKEEGVGDVLYFNIFKTECRNDNFNGTLGEIHWPFVDSKDIDEVPSLIGDPGALDVRIFTPAITVDQFLAIFKAESYSVVKPVVRSNSDQVSFQMLSNAVTTVAAIRTILEKEMLGNTWNYSMVTHSWIDYCLGLLKPNDHTTCVKLSTKGGVTLTEFIIDSGGVVSLINDNGTLTLEQTVAILTKGYIMEKAPASEPTYKDRIHTAFQIFRNSSVYKTALAMQTIGKFRFKKDHYRCELLRDQDNPKEYPFTLIIEDAGVIVFKGAIRNGDESQGVFTDHTHFSWDNLYSFLTGQYEIIPDTLHDAYEKLDLLPKEFPSAPQEEPEPQFIDLRFIDVSDEWVQWYAKKKDTSLAHAYREGMQLMVRLQEQLGRRIEVDGPRPNTSSKDPEPDLIDRGTADLSKDWMRWFIRRQGASEITAYKAGMQQINELNLRVSETLARVGATKGEQ